MEFFALMPERILSFAPLDELGRIKEVLSKKHNMCAPNRLNSMCSLQMGL